MTAPDTFSIGPLLVYKLREPRQRRVLQLCLGLMIFGFALGLSVEAALGVNPWTVFHGGLENHTAMSIGTATSVVGLVLLLLFPVFKQPLGIGTLLNVAIIGPAVDVTLFIIPDLTSLPIRIVALFVAPILIGLGSGLYIGVGLGPGPRDGLMTALERAGLPIWLARSAIELTALILGALLGGDVGWGTIWMAGSVGYWVQLFLTRLRMDKPVQTVS